MKRITCAVLALILMALLSAGASAEAVKLPVDLSGGMPYSTDRCVGENVYEDASLRVEITQDMVGNTRVHLARRPRLSPSASTLCWPSTAITTAIRRPAAAT